MKLKRLFHLIICLGLLIFSCFGRAAGLNEDRIKLIIDALNAKPESLIRPLVATDVELGLQDGRVNVNAKAKFSYYVHIQRSQDARSPLILIPMATSRYTPTYYQTDDWWDAHKAEMDQAKAAGKPMPRQDMDEVETWLKEMKLSTNPDVIVITPAEGRVERVSLQKFLLSHYQKFYAKDGFITLFRGAEKAGEMDAWNRRETPRGVRYWTPTANYAWRYARKNLDFLDELLKGRTPLFKFKVPVKAFEAMVLRNWQQMVLGTELTKNAHKAFDSKRVFQDHLYSNQAYMGEGRYGVEFEIRSNRSGAENMAAYYQGPASIEDLVSDRIAVLERTMNRLIEKNPEEKETLSKNYLQRIRQVEFEARLLTALKGNYSNEVVNRVLSEKPAGTSEIANIDYLNLNTWVQKKVSERAEKALKTNALDEQLKELGEEIKHTNYSSMKCGRLFL